MKQNLIKLCQFCEDVIVFVLRGGDILAEEAYHAMIGMITDQSITVKRQQLNARLIVTQSDDIISFADTVAGLCKGSTADSGSVCLGSNPSPAAKNEPLKLMLWRFICMKNERMEIFLSGIESHFK